jgi:hypothetical protein
MRKNIPVPISDCLVETGSSFGTGIKEKISTVLRHLTSKFGDYC